MGSADPNYFLVSGRTHNAFIRDLVGRHGTSVDELERMLDLGCGCGRIARWWQDLASTEVNGCDVNPELTAWCSANLPFMKHGAK